MVAARNRVNSDIHYCALSALSALCSAIYLFNEKLIQSVLSFYSIALIFYGFQGLFEKEGSTGVTMLWGKLCMATCFKICFFLHKMDFDVKYCRNSCMLGILSMPLKIFNSNHHFLSMEKKWFNGCPQGRIKVEYMRHYCILALVPWDICFLILGIY